MKLRQNKIRLVYWLSVVLLMVFFVMPVFSFFYLFNENKVKNMIINQFDNNYHIKIDGHVTPIFWHGLSIQLNNISITTKNDNNLLHIDNINCQLSWFNLALGTYKIKRMSVNDIDVYENNVITYGLANLLHLNNFDQSAFSQLQLFQINHLQTIGDVVPYQINDGTIKISWDNGQPEFILGFKLSPNNTYVTASGELGNLEKNTITFDNFNMHIYNDLFNLGFLAKTRYQIDSKQLLLQNIIGDLEFGTYSGKINATKVMLSLSGLEGMGVKIDLNLSRDFVTQNIIITFNKIISPAFKQVFIDKLQSNYVLNVQNNNLKVNSTLEKLKIDESANITSNSCINNVSLNPTSVLSNKFNAVLSGICEYVPETKLINLHLAGNLNSAPTKIDLQLLTATDKPKLVIAGHINDLVLSKVDRDKLLPLYYDKSKLPFAWLSLIDMSANLLIKNFSLDRINLTNVATDFSVTNGQLLVHQLRADIYDGVLSASGKITKIANNNYYLETHQTIQNLNLQSMFKDLFDVDAISGKANLQMNVSANNIVSYNDLHKKLNGLITINASHGAFQGVDFNLFANQKPIDLNSTKSTQFERLNAKFNFANGMSKNGSVKFYSPYVITTGNGIIDFVNTTLNYNLTIKSALPQNNQQISSVVIPVTATGDLFDPKIIIQNIHLFTGSPRILRAQSPSRNYGSKSKFLAKKKHNKLHQKKSAPKKY